MGDDNKNNSSSGMKHLGGVHPGSGTENFSDNLSMNNNIVPNINNTSNPANKCPKKFANAHGTGASRQISVAPILHIQQDSRSLGSAIVNLESPTIKVNNNNNTNSENKEQHSLTATIAASLTSSEPLPSTSGLYNHDSHGSPSSSSVDRAELAVVRISNI